MFYIDAPIAVQELTFPITETRLYVPAVTLSTQYNAKLLEQLRSGFERTINWNKYERKVTVEQQNRYLDFLILSFQNNVGRKSYTRYYLSLVEIKDYNVVINGRNFFDQPVKNNFITYDNIRKIVTCQGDGYTTGCLLDYSYFNNYYKVMAID